MLSVVPIPEPVVLALATLGVFVISFMRGAFGGGFAVIGIPLLALVMDPIAAGALLAPMFCLMDIVALRYWRPSTWSKPDVAVLVPGLLMGIGLGFFAMRLVDAFILEFGKVSPELARVAYTYYSQAELRDIGLKVFTCSTNKITVALGVDDPDDIQERIGIRIHEQFYPPPR